MKSKHIRDRERAIADWERYSQSQAGLESSHWSQVQLAFSCKGELKSSYISYSGGGVEVF